MIKLVFFSILILYVVIGLVVTRFVRNRDDFYVMGERGSTILIVGTLCATAVSSVTLMGMAGQAYSEGPLVIPTLGSFGAWLGMLISIFYVGRKMKAMKIQTVPEFFEKRFKSAPVSIIVTIIMIVGLLGYGIVDFIGAGLILSEITGISFSLMIIIFTLTIMVFTVLGGMFGVIVTDTVMLITMLAVSVIIIPLLIGEAGFEPIKNLTETYPNFWTLGGMEERPISFGISQFLVWILFFSVMPAHISRIFPAKNDFVLLKAGVYTAFIYPLLQLPIFIGAAAMKVLEPNVADPDKVMILGFMDYTSSATAGIAIAGIMAAIMSTASTVFILIGFALSRDLLERFAFKDLSNKQSLILGRITQTGIAIIACIIALMRPAAIYWISIYAGAFFAVGWFPSLFASFIWRRMNSKAAIASMITGVTSFIILGELMRCGIVSFPFEIDELIIAFVLSVIVLIIVALNTRPNEYELVAMDNMEELSPSKDTIDQFAKKPNGLAKMKSQYRQIIITAIIATVVAIATWSFFIIKLA